MPDKSYWEQRQEQKFLSGEKKIKDYYLELEKSFEQSKKEIHKVINEFYGRYANENGLSFTAAQRALSNEEIGDLKKFIALVNKNMGEYNQELNNMSIKARITRYQALEKQIDALLQQLYSVEYKHKGEDILKDIYTDTYYQTWFDFDQYNGFHQEFAQVTPYTIEELIKYPFNGADYSTRLWKQKDHMLQQLNESITTMLIQGKNPQTLAGDFSKKFDTKKFEAYRLLHTEGSFMIEKGTLAAYKEEGVIKYQILATLDIKTSDICRGQDGNIYDVDNAVTGVNYPPFHIFCRSTTVPYYEDSDYSDNKRVARDPVTDKSYEVPADMNYKEWHKKYIESNPEAVIAEKKWKNRFTDKRQFEEYKEKLGTKYLPKSFDSFQDLKYANNDEYGILKAQVKGMTYYNKAIVNEPAITEHVKNVAENVGTDVAGLEYRIKGKDSYLRKIRSNYNPEGNEYEIKDILRYTYTADSVKYTDKTLKSIDAHKNLGYNTIEVKNYWLDKNNPYNGINTVIASPKGQKFELQYHTPGSFDVKNGEMHKLYEKWRLLPNDSEEKVNIEIQMKKLSESMKLPKDIERVK